MSQLRVAVLLVIAFAGGTWFGRWTVEVAAPRPLSAEEEALVRAWREERMQEAIERLRASVRREAP